MLLHLLALVGRARALVCNSDENIEEIFKMYRDKNRDLISESRGEQAVHIRQSDLSFMDICN